MYDLLKNPLAKGYRSMAQGQTLICCPSVGNHLDIRKYRKRSLKHLFSK